MSRFKVKGKVYRSKVKFRGQRSRLHVARNAHITSLNLKKMKSKIGALEPNRRF